MTDRQLDFRILRQALAAKAQFAFGGKLANTQGQIAVAEYDGLCEAAPVFALSKFEIRHVGRRSPGRRGSFATQHSRCEFGFCRKGFAPTPEIQLAVGQQPVYNPALRCFR